MVTHQQATARRQSARARQSARPQWVQTVPFVLLKPLLRRVVSGVATRHPELIDRLGQNASKRFLIDPKALPFVLLLVPDPKQPQLTAHDRTQDPEHDVRICGNLLTLLRMIDGRSDGDALFFSRDLSITGDTEAIVALRNALDNMDTTLADDVAACFGVLSRPVRAMLDLSFWLARNKS